MLTLVFIAGLVKERPLDQWKETLAVLCSHSNLDEFQGLCDALARRLSGGGLAHAATLCWICAAKVDQALHVWAKELVSKQGSVSELQVSLLMTPTRCLGALAWMQYSKSLSVK